MFGSGQNLSQCTRNFEELLKQGIDNMASSLSIVSLTSHFLGNLTSDFSEWVGVPLIICPGNSSGWGTIGESFISLGKGKVNFYFQEPWLHKLLDAAVPRREWYAELWLPHIVLHRLCSAVYNSFPRLLVPDWANKRFFGSSGLTFCTFDIGSHFFFPSFL